MSQSPMSHDGLSDDVPLASLASEAEAGALPLVKDLRVPVLPVITPRAIKWGVWGAGRSMRRYFHTLEISTRGLVEELPDKPVLVYCNHPSVWTPSIGLLAATKLWPAWRHYAPANPQWMTQRHLSAKAGFFGVPAGKRGVRVFMETAGHVLACPGSMLWVANTARPCDPRARPIAIHPMILRLARQFDDITLLPLAIEHGFTKGKLPDTHLRLGEPISTLDAGRRSIEGWRSLLQRRLQITLERLADQVCEPEHRDFKPLW